MNIEEIPFNAHVGIQRSPGGDNLQLHPEPHHLNHMGTVHAAVIFSLAEATSGEYLIRFRANQNDIVGVLRRSSAKYSLPGTGALFSRVKTSDEEAAAIIEKLDTTGKALFEIEVGVLNEQDQTVASFSFTWFLSKGG